MWQLEPYIFTIWLPHFLRFVTIRAIRNSTRWMLTAGRNWLVTLNAQLLRLDYLPVIVDSAQDTIVAVLFRAQHLNMVFPDTAILHLMKVQSELRQWNPAKRRVILSNLKAMDSWCQNLIGASRSDNKLGNRQVVLERIRWNMLLFQFAHHLAAALLNKKKLQHRFWHSRSRATASMRHQRWSFQINLQHDDTDMQGLFTSNCLNIIWLNNLSMLITQGFPSSAHPIESLQFTSARCAVRNRCRGDRLMRGASAIVSRRPLVLLQAAPGRSDANQ